MTRFSFSDVYDDGRFCADVYLPGTGGVSLSVQGQGLGQKLLQQVHHRILVGQGQFNPQIVEKAK